MREKCASLFVPTPGKDVPDARANAMSLRAAGMPAGRRLARNARASIFGGPVATSALDFPPKLPQIYDRGSGSVVPSWPAPCSAVAPTPPSTLPS